MGVLNIRAAHTNSVGLKGLITFKKELFHNLFRNVMNNVSGKFTELGQLGTKIRSILHTIM